MPEGPSKNPPAAGHPGFPLDRYQHVRRRAPSERIERLRARGDTAHLEELRRRAARWAADNADALRDVEPAIPEGLLNREADNWAPLFAIGDACGGDWPERIRDVAVRFSGAEEEALGVELLADICKIHELHPANAHASKDMALWLGEMEDRPWADTGAAIRLPSRRWRSC